MQENGGLVSTGERIRKFRKARGMTQAQVAKAIGATEGAVRHYEHGDRTPGPEQIAAIAEVLGVSPAALADYALEDARDALEVLFRLEDMAGLHPVDTGDGMALMVDVDVPGAQKIEYALIAWKSMRDDLASGVITSDEYEEWRGSFEA
jgi:transcriptional regulator with XRE-family HTH domain